MRFMFFSILVFTQILSAAPSIVVDEISKLVDTNAATDDEFGTSVAISGDTAVVGAYGDDCNNGGGCGSAIIFERNLVTGLFEQRAKLTASDGKAYDHFGSSVAISGNTVVIGAYAYNNSVANDVGSAYIFEKPSSGGWIDTNISTKLTAFDGEENDYFGSSVAVSGDTVLIGAYGNNASAYESGAAYLFKKPSSGGWVDTNISAKLTASDGNISDRFGSSVSISDDTAIIGAYGDDCHNGNDAFCGSAIIFVRNATTGVFEQRAKLTAFDAAREDQFGYSVAISNDTVVIGADYDDDKGSFSGSAYIYEKPPSGWVTDSVSVKLTASDGASEDQFGTSVAISGNTVIVGAYYDDDNGSNSGSAYLFQRPAGGWITDSENAKITASDADGYDWFGWSVAISDDMAIVGAHRNDDAGQSSGSAYIFKGEASKGINPSLIMYLLN